MSKRTIARISPIGGDALAAAPARVARRTARSRDRRTLERPRAAGRLLGVEEGEVERGPRGAAEGRAPARAARPRPKRRRWRRRSRGCPWCRSGRRRRRRRARRPGSRDDVAVRALDDSRTPASRSRRTINRTSRRGSRRAGRPRPDPDLRAEIPEGALGVEPARRPGLSAPPAPPPQPEPDAAVRLRRRGDGRGRRTLRLARGPTGPRVIAWPNSTWIGSARWTSRSSPTKAPRATCTSAGS